MIEVVFSRIPSSGLISYQSPTYLIFTNQHVTFDVAAEARRRASVNQIRINSAESRQAGVIGGWRAEHC